MPASMSIATASRSTCAGRSSLPRLALLMLDALVVIALSGGLASMLPRRRVATTLLAAGLLAALAMQHPAQAQTAQQPPPQPTAQEQDFAMKATNQTHLAYVVTGDADVDAISKAGLQGLTLFLAQRTALEAGEPIGLDPARDELAFFPLIYWPVSANATKPSQAALDHIDTYMKRGGTVLFDTRDAVDAPPGPGGEMQGPGMVALRAILSSLDIPELEPVPRDHVLTKTFFLLHDFPGRFTTGQLWVEALPAETDGRRQPPGARRRRRVVDPDHLERFGRRLGDAPGRPADAAAGAGRTAPARIRLPRRRQHRDVRADRQLQSRPGAYPGAARAAGTVGA